MKTPKHFFENTRRRCQRGFSLVELLVVLTIVSVLSAATVPAIQSLLQSTSITQGGQTVVEQINLARQIASSRNTTVQIRLIKLAKLQNSSATGYNAIQLWGTPSGASQAVPLSRILLLPASAVISEDTTNYSKILSTAGATVVTGTMTVPAGAASYSSFSVMPSGMIPVPQANIATAEASAMTAAYLSVVPARYGATTTAPGTAGAPKNYLVVQMNPNTGSTLVYRP